MVDLLTSSDLPPGFLYPHSFLKVVDFGLINLEPWYILEGERLNQRFRGLQLRYPTRVLVPFAERQDNDDVACWEPTVGKEVVMVVHDYASTVGKPGKFHKLLRVAS